MVTTGYGARSVSWGRRGLMSLSIEDLAGEYHQGWVGRNPDTIAALHTEDSTFHIHGLD